MVTNPRFLIKILQSGDQSEIEIELGKFDFDHHFAFFKTLFKGKNFAVRRVREG